MADTIRGPVTKIVDGDTFDMKVIHVGKKINMNITMRKESVLPQ